VITILGIVAGVLGISLLIVVHELGHHGAARAAGMRVERFSVGFGKVIASFHRWGTEFAISALPLGGYVKIAGMAPGDDVTPGDPSCYANQPAWRRFGVILAGPAMNYAAAIVLALLLLPTIGLDLADPASRIGVVQAGGPAAAGGLEKGDRVVAAGGAPVATWVELVARVQASPGQPLALEVERGGARVQLTVTPRDAGGVGKVGIGPATAPHRAPGAATLTEAFTWTNQLAWAQVAGFGALFKGAKGTELSGPIGIVEQLVTGFHEGVGPFLTLLWKISIVLAVLNLLPIPGLDGARLVFLLIEIVTRRRVNERIEGIVHTVGIVALVALIAWVTVFGDLARLLKR